MKGFSYAGYLLGAAAVIAIVFVIAHRYRSYKDRDGGPACRPRPSRPVPPSDHRRPALRSRHEDPASGRRARSIVVGELEGGADVASTVHRSGGRGVRRPRRR